MKTDLTSVDIIGKETSVEAEGDFILDNWEPSVKEEYRIEHNTSVLSVAMAAVLLLMFWLVSSL